MSAAAWPLSVLVERGARDVASSVDRLLIRLARKSNPVRCGDALLLLLSAVYRDGNARDQVLSELLATCTMMESVCRVSA